MAHELILTLPEGAFDKDDIHIEAVDQMGANHAVAEVSVRAALKLEKVRGQWIIREVRLGNGQWEKLENFRQALRRVKEEETRNLLDQVAAAAEKYVAKKGSLPDFSDYVALSNALHPDYMTPLIREDAWGRPLAAYRLGPASLRLVSPGPDGILGSGDDIELSKSFSP